MACLRWMSRRKTFGERLGARVRAHRAALGWSQARLAERVDVTPNYIGIVERGTKLPTLDTLVAIAKALGVSPAELIADPRAPDPWIEELAVVAAAVPEGRRALAVAMLRVLADPSTR